MSKSTQSKILGSVYFTFDLKSTKLHGVDIHNGLNGLARYRYDLYCIQTFHNAFFSLDADTHDISHLCYLYDNDKASIRAAYESFKCCICGINHPEAIEALTSNKDNHYLKSCARYDDIIHNKKRMSCNHRSCSFLHHSSILTQDIKDGKYKGLTEVDDCYRADKKEVTAKKSNGKVSTDTSVVTIRANTSIVNGNKWVNVVRSDSITNDSNTNDSTPIINPNDFPAITPARSVTTPVVIPTDNTVAGASTPVIAVTPTPVTITTPAPVTTPVITPVIAPVTAVTPAPVINNEPVVITGNSDTDKIIIDFCKKFNISTCDDSLVYTIYTRCKLFKGIFESITGANVNKMEFNMMLSFLGFDTKNENTVFIKALVLKDEKNKVIKELTDMIALIDSFEN